MPRNVARVALFLIGLALSLHYGRRGYMPLDQSIVFDGGWRILSGQVPFRDFHAPNGLVPHAMQAGFFLVFGVNWFAYCLHAAVINGLFALLVFELLSLLGVRTLSAFYYAALSALVLYPPFGVPYMDQHAFFFSLAAIHFALAARKCAGRRKETWLWLAVPIALALAYASKQIPSVFAAPIALAIALGGRRDLARRIALLAAGSLAVVAVLALLAFALGVDLARLDYYFRELPAEVGVHRFDYLPNAEQLLRRVNVTDERLGLWTIRIARGPVLLALFALGLAGLILRARKPELARSLFRGAALVLLAGALLLMCLAFIVLTSNQAEIGVPYVFVALGLLPLAYEASTREVTRTGSKATGMVGVVLALALAVVAAHDAWHFNATVNETRMVNDIAWDPAVADAAQDALPERLSFLRWQVPPLCKYTAGELRDLIAFLRSRPENVLLVSDASIVYGLAGKRSMAPSLWFHPGLTIPPPESPWFQAYEDDLLAKVERDDMRLIVLEGEKTWIGRKLSDWPRLDALVREKTRAETSFGPFRVLELAP